ncbi:MAG: YdcF family protein [Myxococcaceae bacterium]|nr:YdcF family protein [Myxococcaceae bacterium]
MLSIATLLRRIDECAQAVPPTRAGAIVVLGAKVGPRGEPSAPLLRRVRAGVALFHQGVAPALLLTGGSAPGHPSEAEVMRALAVAEGVPERALVLEPHSRSTEENARFSAPLLRTLGASELAVVTDDFHLLRGSTHFRLQGFTVFPAGAGGPSRTSDVWGARLREVGSFLRSPSLIRAALAEPR